MEKSDSSSESARSPPMKVDMDEIIKNLFLGSINAARK